MNGMSEDWRAPGGSPTDEIVEFEQVVDRLVEFDAALQRGLTLNFTDDDTLRRLPEDKRLRVDRLFECLKFIDEVRRDEETARVDSHAFRNVPSLPWAPRVASDPPFLVGRFEIGQELGRGAHGIVFQARDRILDRQVAVKFPRPEVVLSLQLRKRLAEEGKTAAKLHHPNIVAVLEAGEFGPCCYLAQELCTGPSVAAWLAARKEPVSFAVAVQVMIGLTDAVQYAHSHGVLHRDLKPSNALLQPVELAPGSNIARQAFPYTVKLTDFGIAKVLDEEADGNLTLTGSVMGTATYMSPEQAAGQRSKIGQPTDIYALGAILYELLTGGPPFDGDSHGEVLRRVIEGVPIAPQRLRADVPRDLQAICLRCLEYSPQDRYGSATDLAADLKRFIDGEPVRARPSGKLRRFARRIRQKKFSSRSVLMGSMIVVSLIGIIAATNWRTLQQRDEAVGGLESAKREQVAAFRQAYPDDIWRVEHLLQHTAAGETDRSHAAREAREILAKYISHPGDVDLRGFEWHYLWNRLNPKSFAQKFTELLEIQAHEREAYCVSFSPDGKLLATSSADKTARIWDAETGQLRVTLSGHTHDVNCVEFSPDGKTLATGSEDRTVRLWDAATGALRDVLWKHTDEVTGVAFNPKTGHVAAGAHDGVLQVWDLASRRQITTIKAHQNKRVEALVYSPDGNLLATVGADRKLRLWDASNSYRLLREYPSSQAVAFSHDGQFLAVGDSYEALVYQVATGQLLTRTSLRGRDVRSLHFTADDSKLIAVGDEASTNLVDLTTGEMWNPFRIAGTIWCAACSRDGRRMATTDSEGKLRMWDSSRGLAFPKLIGDAGPSLGIQLALAPDGKQLVVGSTDRKVNGKHFGQLALWNIVGQVPKRVTTIDPRDGQRYVYSVAYSPDGRTLAVGGILSAEDACIQLFDTATWKEKRRLKSCGVAPAKLIFSLDASMLIVQRGVGGGRDWRLQFWDTVTGQMVDSMPLYDGAMPIALSPDGRFLAVTGTNTEGQIEFIRLSDRKKIAKSSKFRDVILSLEFTRDGKYLIAEGFDGRVYFLDCATRQVVRQFVIPGATHIDHVGMALSPDERTIGLASRNGIVLVHVETGRTLCSLAFPSPITGMRGLAFSSDGKTIAADGGANDTSGVYLWQIDVPDGQHAAAVD
jgi:eukaryotic-like serine/threonine-protein kinase